MSGRVVDLSRRETAARERDRLIELLAAIEAVREARSFWDALPEEPQTDAARQVEASHLVQLMLLEDSLRDRVLDPNLAAFLTCILEQVAAIAEGRPCV